ncbi:hypothetical protein BN2475_90113 [Paraburkholderia ribeironis]|uniref:Uncharacterized protein n=1 Tax=Paraburkholderia ribeironis TaxID=1247936 RepID=A0A1N7RN96_9BURK|nr:hypothetical protein BN2475_90113 [Paraburkholderia ribeironis]
MPFRMTVAIAGEMVLYCWVAQGTVAEVSSARQREALALSSRIVTLPLCPSTAWLPRKRTRGRTDIHIGLRT